MTTENVETTPEMKDDKGIKVLSVINACLVLLFLVFVLLVGPTKFILEMGVTSIGHMFQNFIKMATWTDPLRNAQFVETWTIFYWAWWMALAPFVGMFVTKISRGRTIREVIFGMLGFGSRPLVGPNSSPRPLASNSS